jgi:opacity protein-like surface antigen
MHQMPLKVLSALLLVSASISAHSQISPAAQGGGPLPLRVGAGYSNYGTDWGSRLGGPAVWIAFDLPKVSPAWSGFQIEVEGRDLNYTRSGGNPPDPKLRQYTFAGGVNYAWRYDAAFHPYAKFLVGLGNISFSHMSVPDAPLTYTHDSRAFYAPAGGVDVRVHHRIWIRGNYEYQFWRDFINHHTLTPHGFTVGVFYDFSRFALAEYKP